MNDPKIHSENGFVVLQAVIIGIIISIVGGALMMFFSTQNQQWSRARLIEDLEQLNTKAVMIFSNATACGANRTAAAFGTSLNEMKSLSVSGNIQVHYPTSPAPASGIMVKKGGRYRSLQFVDVRFDFGPGQPRLVATPATVPSISEKSYLAELKIVVRDGSSTRTTTIPFYFVTDASDNFIRCFATLYPKPNFTPPVTLEDAVCREWHRQEGTSLNPATEAYYYAPEHQTCFRAPPGVPDP